MYYQLSGCFDIELLNVRKQCSMSSCLMVFQIVDRLVGKRIFCLQEAIRSTTTGVYLIEDGCMTGQALIAGIGVDIAS